MVNGFMSDSKKSSQCCMQVMMLLSVWLVGKVIKKIGEWLMGLCQTTEEQSTMLHTEYDSAFRWACGYGHLETTKWLWGLCQTAEELSAMLHARDDLAFVHGEKGHQNMGEWFMGLCQTAEGGQQMLIMQVMMLPFGLSRRCIKR